MDSRQPEQTRRSSEQSDGPMISLATLSIKGAGESAHMADLAEAIVIALGSFDRFRVTLHRPAQTELGLTRRVRRAADIGAITLGEGDDASIFAIKETSARPLPRVAEPHLPALTQLVLRDDGAEIDIPDPQLALRYAIAMSRMMLERTVGKLRWQIAELKLIQSLAVGRLTTSLDIRLAGRFWKVGLYNQGVRVGHLIAASKLV